MDPRLTAQALVERLREEQARRRRRATDARARLPAAVRALVEEFGARRVVLFGSLLQGELYEDSDLDLLVEGLPREKYFAALGRVAEITGILTEIVPAESGRPEIVERALRDGEVLHES